MALTRSRIWLLPISTRPNITHTSATRQSSVHPSTIHHNRSQRIPPRSIHPILCTIVFVQWLDMDSPCEESAWASELAFKQEMAWATHLALAAVMAPAPKPGRCANYARCINQVRVYLRVCVCGASRPFEKLHTLFVAAVFALVVGDAKRLMSPHTRLPGASGVMRVKETKGVAPPVYAQEELSTGFAGQKCLAFVSCWITSPPQVSQELTYLAVWLRIPLVHPEAMDPALNGTMEPPVGSGGSGATTSVNEIDVGTTNLTLNAGGAEGADLVRTKV